MKTWESYKDYVKRIDPEGKKDLEEVEALAGIIGAMITERKTQGISQRELAARCGVPQSSVARIEAYQTTPKLETMIKLLRPLGLQLQISHVK